ncbi:MAG: hypothetical protein AAF211_32865, partial [Myxococcota bacterium]
EAEDWFRSVPFVREAIDNGILLAHANPFGNWRYVDGDEVYREAARVLARRGLSVGIFGHTHQCRFFTEPPRDRALGRHRLAWGPREAGAMPEVRVLNAGSIGQPRDRTRTATMLRLKGSGRTGEATLHVVGYDVGRHLDRLRRLPLSPTTLDRLTSFFELTMVAGS